MFIYLQGESVDSYEDQRCVFEIEMEKDENGLGLTVAGYICEKGIQYLQILQQKML